MFSLALVAAGLLPLGGQAAVTYTENGGFGAFSDPAKWVSGLNPPPNGNSDVIITVGLSGT